MSGILLPREKVIYAVRKPQVSELLTHDGKRLLLRVEHDFSQEQRLNQQRKNEIGKGWSETRHFKEEFEAPQDLLMSDPDGIEWWHTRSRSALRRFLAKYPWCRTSEGGI